MFISQFFLYIYPTLHCLKIHVLLVVGKPPDFLVISDQILIFVNQTCLRNSAINELVLESGVNMCVCLTQNQLTHSLLV